jgi:hypothetical protein
MSAAELAGLGLLALLAVPASGAEPAEPAPPRPAVACALRLSAEPARLEPDDPRTVRVRVAAPTRPALAASLGRIDLLAADGEGSWTAEWTAPPAGVPQVALLTALAGDGCGYLAVPITGSGDVVVHTRPGARVVVRIAERDFGPAVAGPDGVALVPAEVPPGVRDAYQGQRRIPFDVPPVPHAALAAPAALPADRAQALSLLVVAVDDFGNPHPGPPPALAVSSGRVEPPTPAGPGAWRATWWLAAGPAAEELARAQLPGEPAVELRLARAAGAPAQLEASLDRAVASPGDPPVGVTVALRDAAGNPADGELSARAGAGEVSAAERTGMGAYRLAWTPPARLEGRDQAELHLRSGRAEARVELALRPGAPARLRLTAPRDAVIADGVRTLTVQAEVEDQHGNPAEGVPGHPTAGAGELGAPRRVAPGRYQLLYRPRRVARPARDELGLELPPLSARLALRLHPPLPRLTLGASAGLALQPGGWLGLQAGAEASSWRWLGDQQAGLALALAFSRFHEGSTVVVGGGDARFDGEVRVLTVLASAVWRRSLGRTVTLRLDAGGGAARVESGVAVGGGALVPEARWVPAGSAAAVVGVEAWRGRALLALRGTLLPDARLSSLRGAVTPISLSLGYELDAR